MDKKISNILTSSFLGFIILFPFFYAALIKFTESSDRRNIFRDIIWRPLSLLFSTIPVSIPWFFAVFVSILLYFSKNNNDSKIIQSNGSKGLSFIYNVFLFVSSALVGLVTLVVVSLIGLVSPDPIIVFLVLLVGLGSAILLFSLGRKNFSLSRSSVMSANSNNSYINKWVKIVIVIIVLIFLGFLLNTFFSFHF